MSFQDELLNKINELIMLLEGLNSSFETINLEVSNLSSYVEGEDKPDTTPLKNMIFDSKQSIISMMQTLNILLNSIDGI